FRQASEPRRPRRAKYENVYPASVSFLKRTLTGFFRKWYLFMEGRGHVAFHSDKYCFRLGAPPKVVRGVKLQYFTEMDKRWHNTGPPPEHRWRCLVSRFRSMSRRRSTTICMPQ